MVPGIYRTKEKEDTVHKTTVKPLEFNRVLTMKCNYIF